MLATLCVGVVDRALSRAISPAQRARERAVREGSGHEVAGKRLARALGCSQRAGRLAFSAAYSVGWGALYAAARRRFPALRRPAGLRFAVPFFLACDGVIAPALGLTPSPRKVPWQPNAKELLDHAAWTATAELALRAAP